MDETRYLAGEVTKLHDLHAKCAVLLKEIGAQVERNRLDIEKLEDDLETCYKD